MRESKTNKMKPTKEQIENAIYEAVVNPTGFFPNGFVNGVQWLLEWQKTQPLTVYYVMVGENEIVDVCRTQESAEKSISDLKKDYPKVEFWIDEREIK